MRYAVYLHFSDDFTEKRGVNQRLDCSMLLAAALRTHSDRNDMMKTSEANTSFVLNLIHPNKHPH